MTLFLSPHCDDETLFGAFTLLRERPAVAVCFPSVRDYGDDTTRVAETDSALQVLGYGQGEFAFLGAHHRQGLIGALTSIARSERPERVWAPDLNASHSDHRDVHQAAVAVFGSRVRTYHTYGAGGQKVRSEREVSFEPFWVELKLRALACYRSQLTHPRAYQFFVEDLREYYGDTP